MLYLLYLKKGKLNECQNRTDPNWCNFKFWLCALSNSRLNATSIDNAIQDWFTVAYNQRDDIILITKQKAYFSFHVNSESNK